MNTGQIQNFTIVPGDNSLGEIEVDNAYSLYMPVMSNVLSGTLSFYWDCSFMSPSEWLVSGNEMKLDDYWISGNCDHLITLGIHPDNVPPTTGGNSGFDLNLLNSTSVTIPVKIESTAFKDQIPYKSVSLSPGTVNLGQVNEGQFRLFLPYIEDIKSGKIKILWNCVEVPLNELNIKEWGIWVDKSIAVSSCQNKIAFVPDGNNNLSLSFINNTSSSFSIKLKKSTTEEYNINVLPGSSSTYGPISSGDYVLQSDYQSDLTLGLVKMAWNDVEIDPKDWITDIDKIKVSSRYVTGSGINHVIRFNQANSQLVKRYEYPDPAEFYTQVTSYKFPTQEVTEELLHEEASRKVTYFDPFGRAKQEVYLAVSPNRKDIVVPITYNLYGDADTKYLPYVGRGESSSFRKTAVEDQEKFYKYPLSEIERSEYAFSKVVYENSPFKRIKEEGGVGESWQPNGTNGKTTKFNKVYNTDYSATTSHRGVRQFSVDPSTLLLSDAGPLGEIKYFSANELYVEIVKDVHWKAADERLNTVETYTDKSGKKILVRNYIKDENEHTVMLSTYYVYDRSGALCYVLPPVLNPDSGEISHMDIDKYGIKYKYDFKGRKIEEKQPGVAPTFYVYNRYDQLLATQNPNQRENNQWRFSKYDFAGRLIMNGVMQSSLSRESLQSDVNTNVNTYEKPIASGIGYTNESWPVSNVLHYASIMYYDNYDYLPNLPSYLSYSAFDNISKNDFPTGQVVAVKTFMGNNQEMWAVSYYDGKGQVIQTQSDNHLGGADLVNNYYSFSGLLVQTERKHFDASKIQRLFVRNINEYDHAGRLLKIKQKINLQDEVTLAAFKYNELGELTDKKLHQKAGQTTYLQSIDYRYHEKGWLMSINDANLNSNSAYNDGDVDSKPDLFGIKLAYNDEPLMPQFNGNIAAMRWKTSQVTSQSVAPPKMGYQYRYDALNRMTNAISEQNGQVDNAHNEQVSYDINGNILNLRRKAQANGAIRTIDDLDYTYDGYRAKRIDDVSTDAHKNLGYHDQTSQTNEYVYDANGNIIEDKNKGLVVTYDENNQIKKIIFGGDVSHNIEFLYDRTGRKLQAKYNYPTGNYTIDYLEGIQYQQGQLAFVHTGEGRARWNGVDYSYEYDLKDHLGNTRVTFMPDINDVTQTTVKVIQQTSYYPYGMPMYGDSDLHLAYVSGEKNKYLYSGKELYDQGNLNWFDHGSRMYDPAIGRWSAMDPAAQFINPYLAMGNNPVIGVDPNGEWVHLAMGAVMGGWMNWMSHGAQFNGKGLGYFGVGALAGAIGAGVGSGMSSALVGTGFGAGFVGSSAAMSVGSGFMSSSLVGAAGGVAGGFISGFGNSMLQGGSFSGALETGAISGGWGALSGALLGGVIGGSEAQADGRNFWTGGGNGNEFYIAANESSNGSRYLSRQEMELDYNNLIGSRDGVYLVQAQSKLNTFVDLELDPSKLSRTGHIISKRGLDAAVIKSSGSGGFRNRMSSNIKIAPALKGYSLLDKNSVFKHEFIHAYHYMKGLSNIDKYTERAASDFSRKYNSSLGLPKNKYSEMYMGAYPSAFSWENVNKLIPLWLKF